MRYQIADSKSRKVVQEGEPGEAAKEVTVPCHQEQKCTTGTRRVVLLCVLVTEIPDCKRGVKTTTGYVCRFTKC